jgi:hypothetical protein
VLRLGDLLTMRSALRFALERGAPFTHHPADFEHTVFVENQVARLIQAREQMPPWPKDE